MTEKVAILGGGIGSLTTAYALTEAPQDYDITVYQLGWRVGGKGASGRNLSQSARIEEHGLHVWSGLYDNSFRVMRACYAELDRAPDAPLATWQDAFKPHNFMVLEEEYEGEWFNWVFNLPTNNQLPGDPDAKLFLPLWSYIAEAVELIREFLEQSPPEPPSARRELNEKKLDKSLRKTIDKFKDELDLDKLNLGQVLLKVAGKLAEQMHNEADELELADVAHWFGGVVERIVEKIFLKLLGAFMDWYWTAVNGSLADPETRKFWIFINFAYGNICGVLEDDIIQKGFGAVDDQDYRTWLAQYLHPDDDLTINSPLAWVLYDANFAYVDGDLNQPNLSAGVALYTAVRMAFTWKGSLIWKMQAGMGDTVFTPLYQVLKARGVKFKFFHKVTGLHLNDEQDAIDSISVAVQAKLKPEYQAEGYQPLIDIKGLPCWPSEPFFEQLQDGESLKAQGVNFEDWCGPEVETIQLQAGQDFDQVVLGIPVGSLPYLACELIEAKSSWRQMVEQVKTTRTQCLQLWLKPTAYELGWTLMQEPILGTYRVTPLNTWADMSHLLNREGWPAEGKHYPLNIAYFCGPMADEKPLNEGECGPTQTCEELSQKAGNTHAEGVSLDLLQKHIGVLWPNTTTADGFNWNLLVDNQADPPSGPARLQSQYFKGNVQPNERYTLSTAGSTQYRLEPGNSGFKNLFLAGDWTKNGFNLGNIESTVMSGLLASNAISGSPKQSEIVGLDFGQPD